MFYLLGASPHTTSIWSYIFSHSSPKIPCAFAYSLIMFYIPAFTENLKKNYFVIESCHIIMYYLCTFSDKNVKDRKKQELSLRIRILILTLSRVYTIAFFIILFFFLKTKQNSYCSLHIYSCIYNSVFPGLECLFLSAQQTSTYQARPILLLLTMGTLSRAQ